MTTIFKKLFAAVALTLMYATAFAQQQNPQADPAIVGVTTAPSILLGPNAQGVTTIQYGNGGSDPIPVGTVQLILSLNTYLHYLAPVNITGFTLFSPDAETVVLTNSTVIPAFFFGSVQLRTVAVQATGPNGSGGFNQKLYSVAVSVLIPQQVGNSNANDDNGTANISVGNAVLSPLPVTLMNFAATGINCNTKIDWSTAAEADLDYYELEQSTDGNRFTMLQKISGKGSSSNQYNVMLSNTARLMYYRLALVIKDGNRKYSKTAQVLLSCDGAGVFSVYPNPVKKGEAVSLQSTLAELVTYKVTDATGKLTSTGKFQGRTDLPMQLAAGTYLIELSAGKEKKSVKVIVQ